jgi:hypothetical protein
LDAVNCDALVADIRIVARQHALDLILAFAAKRAKWCDCPAALLLALFVNRFLAKKSPKFIRRYLIVSAGSPKLLFFFTIIHGS